jgi:hypothetical protein
MATGFGQYQINSLGPLFRSKDDRKLANSAGRCSPEFCSLARVSLR